jgi:hypothetical protein
MPVSHLGRFAAIYRGSQITDAGMGHAIRGRSFLADVEIA